jgi:hypothetical protein
VPCNIDIVPNRSSPPAILLREAYREDGKVKKRTLANLSSLSLEQVQGMRRVLRGEKLVGVDDLFEAIHSSHHGHVQAVHAALRRLGIAELLSPRPCRERDLVLAMITTRVLAPDSKLATSRWWHTTTIPAEFGGATPTRTICTQRSTGWANARSGLTASWRADILSPGDWRSTT